VARPSRARVRRTGHFHPSHPTTCWPVRRTRFLSTTKRRGVHSPCRALPRPRASHRPLPSSPTNHPLAGATHAAPLNYQTPRRTFALPGSATPACVAPATSILPHQPSAGRCDARGSSQLPNAAASTAQPSRALPRPRASHRPLPSFPTNHLLAGATHAAPLNYQTPRHTLALPGFAAPACVAPATSILPTQPSAGRCDARGAGNNQTPRREQHSIARPSRARVRRTGHFHPSHPTTCWPVRRTRCLSTT